MAARASGSKAVSSFARTREVAPSERAARIPEFARSANPVVDETRTPGSSEIFGNEVQAMRNFPAATPQRVAMWRIPSLGR